jgi:hypothetical protein
VEYDEREQEGRVFFVVYEQISSRNNTHFVYVNLPEHDKLGSMSSDVCEMRFVVAGYAIDSDFRIGNLSKSWHCPTIGQGRRTQCGDHDHNPRPQASVSPPRPLQAYPHATITMAGPKNTLLIEGTFEELTDEFAQYIDALKKSQGDESSNLQGEAADLLKENKKDELLKKLVVGGQALNQAPEKGMHPVL